MKILLIVNPSASSVTARGKVVIHKALSADHDVTVAETGPMAAVAELSCHGPSTHNQVGTPTSCSVGGFTFRSEHGHDPGKCRMVAWRAHDVV